MSRIRVLQVVTDMDRRGAQTFAVDLQDELRKHNLRVKTVALRAGSRANEQAVELLSDSALPISLVRLRRLMRQADVVIAHGSRTLMATAVAGLGVSTPVIYRQISDLNFWAASWRRAARVRLYLRRMARIVALWSGSAQTLERNFAVPASKILEIPNAVHAEHFSPPSASQRVDARAMLGLPLDGEVLCSVGALVPEKGVDLGIYLAGATEWHLLIAGDGPERSRLEDLSRRVGGGQVHFVGSVADVQSVYWASDALLFLSQGGDSMPAVIAEAALCGLPCVSTVVDGTVAMIEHDVSGALIRDTTIAGLSRAVSSVLDRRSDFGAAARVIALDRFSFAQVSDKWLGLVVEVASTRR